eukprot:scaffold39894_cov14-Tisochrysis_lutea.AAC.1
MAVQPRAGNLMLTFCSKKRQSVVQQHWGSVPGGAGIASRPRTQEANLDKDMDESSGVVPQGMAGKWQFTFLTTS